MVALTHMHTVCLSGVALAAPLRDLIPLQHAVKGLEVIPMTKERKKIRLDITDEQGMAPFTPPIATTCNDLHIVLAVIVCRPLFLNLKIQI